MNEYLEIMMDVWVSAALGLIMIFSWWLVYQLGLTMFSQSIAFWMVIAVAILELLLLIIVIDRISEWEF